MKEELGERQIERGEMRIYCKHVFDINDDKLHTNPVGLKPTISPSTLLSQGRKCNWDQAHWEMMMTAMIITKNRKDNMNMLECQPALIPPQPPKKSPKQA